ncbi:hypothetical protein DFH07DRAFT_947447, partial [Mycena maculata]
MMFIFGEQRADDPVRISRSPPVGIPLRALHVTCWNHADADPFSCPVWSENAQIRHAVLPVPVGGQPGGGEGSGGGGKGWRDAGDVGCRDIRGLGWAGLGWEAVGWDDSGEENVQMRCVVRRAGTAVKRGGKKEGGEGGGFVTKSRGGFGPWAEARRRMDGAEGPGSASWQKTRLGGVRVPYEGRTLHVCRNTEARPGENGEDTKEDGRCTLGDGDGDGPFNPPPSGDARMQRIWVVFLVNQTLTTTCSDSDEPPGGRRRLGKTSAISRASRLGGVVNWKLVVGRDLDASVGEARAGKGTETRGWELEQFKLLTLVDATRFSPLFTRASTFSVLPVFLSTCAALEHFEGHAEILEGTTATRRRGGIDAWNSIPGLRGLYESLLRNGPFETTASTDFLLYPHKLPTKIFWLWIMSQRTTPAPPHEDQIPSPPDRLMPAGSPRLVRYEEYQPFAARRSLIRPPSTTDTTCSARTISRGSGSLCRRRCRLPPSCVISSFSRGISRWIMMQSRNGAHASAGSRGSKHMWFAQTCSSR